MFHLQLVVPLFMLWTTFLLSLYSPEISAARAPAPISMVSTVNLDGDADHKIIQDAVGSISDNNSERKKFHVTSEMYSATPAPAPATISKVITVNLNGGADYKAIQDAINSIPENNSEWIKIHVTAGIYREKVNIVGTKGHIILEGEGADKTSIEWGDYSGDPAGHSSRSSATFMIRADNFVASNIAFKNTYDGKATGMRQAVAAAIMGDKSSFYWCSFFGVQDTLFDKHGRHYFKGCYIEGIIDFIYGDATSLYEESTIATVTVDAVSGPGFITANSRDADDASGYVFKNCSVTGSHPTYLGRPWKDHARVVFYETYMSDVVVPEGWNSWGIPSGGEGNITYAESGCMGAGSDTSKRVPWMKNFDTSDLGNLVDRSFIDQEGWIAAQPL